MHRVKNTLDLDCDIKPSVCIFSYLRPPDATKNGLTKFLIIDIIWMIVMKIVLKNYASVTQMAQQLTYRYPL